MGVASMGVRFRGGGFDGRGDGWEGALMGGRMHEGWLHGRQRGFHCVGSVGVAWAVSA